MTPREVAYLVMTFVLTTLINSNYAIVAAFFQIHATTTLGLARDEVARIFAAFALSQLVVSPLSGPMASRFSRRRVLVCGVCGVSSATVLFGYASPRAPGFFDSSCRCPRGRCRLPLADRSPTAR